MRTMDDTIEDGVGHRRIAQMLMPAIARELTRDDRGPPAITVLKDLQQVLAVGVLEPDEAPIIEDQHIDPRETRQHDRVRPVPMREREFGKQARNPPIDHAMALATGLLPQRAGEECLADPHQTRRWPQWSHCSTCPPSAAVRHCSIDDMTRRCRDVSAGPACRR